MEFRWALVVKRDLNLQIYKESNYSYDLLADCFDDYELTLNSIGDIQDNPFSRIILLEKKDGTLIVLFVCKLLIYCFVFAYSGPVKLDLRRRQPDLEYK